MFLIVGLVCLGVGGRDFAYAARLAGTPGTFKVEFADRVADNGRGSNSFHTVWHGTFRSADGRTTDTRATLEDEADGHGFGVSIPVTRAEADTYYTARPDYALGWLCLCLAGGCLVACVLPPVRFGRPFRRADPGNPAWVRASLLTAWGCLITSGTAGLAALVVS
ncbi:hypothetical protein [Streptomyces sp. NPDC046197]|uniref:hypothetical protein n=1 Tax=Streptomyces sp. NPDC046197 TaxID=3154337 RepID=UPI003401A5F2